VQPFYFDLIACTKDAVPQPKTLKNVDFLLVFQRFLEVLPPLVVDEFNATTHCVEKAV
jgi:hypothetical protein